MVNVERAMGAARFVNGDCFEIGLVMPTVTRLVKATGWSVFVMLKFLLLCQRAETAYPLDPFNLLAGDDRRSTGGPACRLTLEAV